MISDGQPTEMSGCIISPVLKDQAEPVFRITISTFITHVEVDLIMVCLLVPDNQTEVIRTETEGLQDAETTKADNVRK